MSSISSELASLTRDGVNAVRDIFSPLISRNTRDFNDVLKRSESEKLRLYCLASSNVPVAHYAKMDTVIDIVVNSAIRSIMNNMIDSDPLAARDFFRTNFTNGNGIVDSFISGAQGINDALGEAGATVVDFKIQFNEGTETVTVNVPLAESKNAKRGGDDFADVREKIAAAKAIQDARKAKNTAGGDTELGTAAQNDVDIALAKLNKNLRDNLARSRNLGINRPASELSAQGKAAQGKPSLKTMTQNDVPPDLLADIKFTPNGYQRADILKSALKNQKKTNAKDFIPEKEAEEQLLKAAKMKYTTGVTSEVISSPTEKNGYTQVTQTRYKIQYASNLAHGDLTVVVTTEVSSMEVDSTKLLEAMASAKNRNVFASYLAARAGTIPWFKGFLLNLGEVRKQVNRDLSKNIGERALGSLLSRTGFTRPKAIGDITEFKNFSVVITADDADRLIRDYGINLSKTSDLVKVFASLNILMLFVIDPLKERATMYQSNRPTEMLVTGIKKENDLIRFSKMINSFTAG